MTETGETAPASSTQMALLMTWLSPAYPVGAFSYSHGIEWAVETGDIASAADLETWLNDILHHGAGWSDAVIFAHLWRAVIAGNKAARDDIADFSASLQPSAERALEATAQGRAFVDMTLKAWPCAALETFIADYEGKVTYPVAVAISAAGHGIPLQAALTAYLHALMANLISAGVRLVPLGQSDGQRITARLMPEIEALARSAMAASLDDAGGAAFLSDIASMKHETQYTRLFRS